MSHAEYNVNFFKKETHDELKSKEGITLIVKNNKPHRINQTIDKEKYSDLNKLYRITALVYTNSTCWTTIMNYCVILDLMG